MHGNAPERAALRERFRALKTEVERRTGNPASSGEDYLELRKLVRELEQLRAELLSLQARDERGRSGSTS